jgi:hypothetical protein
MRKAGTGDRTPRRGQRRGQRRLYVFDGLRMPFVWVTGPRWRRYFGVREACQVRYVHCGETGRIAVVRGPLRAQMLIYSFEDDVRELVLMQREIRPGVYAQWWDPREDLAV